jgi:hypothetical protein
MVCVAALVRVAAGAVLAVWVVRTTIRNVWSVERPSVTVNCSGTWVLAGTFRYARPVEFVTVFVFEPAAVDRRP